MAATKNRHPTSVKGGTVLSKILLATNDDPMKNVAPTIAT